MVNSWILAWCNALRDNSRVNREVYSNLHMEQPALTVVPVHIMADLLSGPETVESTDVLIFFSVFCAIM